MAAPKVEPRSTRATVADVASSLVVVQVRFGEEAWLAATAAAALINTARPFGHQRLASHNEFPSGAVDLNVSHRQFELGCDDVWADKRTACLCSFLFRMKDKINRRRELVIRAQDRVDFHECAAFVLEQTSSTRSNKREKMPE